MYLSQLTLNPQQPQARRDLANRYDLHATLARAFADQPAARPLWRLELARPGEAPRLLVQSLAPPAWDQLAARHPGYLAACASKPLDLAAHLRPGQRLRFRLEANPTVTRDGKRHGLWRLEDQLAWLDRQARGAGCAIDHALVTREDRLVLRKHAGGPPIVLHAVLFDGHLTVRDPAPLAHALAQGLGHGKALGLGLLSLAPG